MKRHANLSKKSEAAPSAGRFANSGNGPALHPVDIGHRHYTALIDPDTAFWSLVRKDRMAATLADPEFLAACRKKAAAFAAEMQALRFGLTPSAVYFNPTERCNLNCKYCYIPSDMRRNGAHMDGKAITRSLSILKNFFAGKTPRNTRPQIVFHGAEPLLNRDAVIAAIRDFRHDFRFGVQTNGTLLDDACLRTLTSLNVGIGLSLDGHAAAVSDRTRVAWNGRGTFDQVAPLLRKLKGYPNYNVICTVTAENMAHLSDVVDFFHAEEVPVCMLNIVRCTLPPSRRIKPDDSEAAGHFLRALDRTHALYRRTGRKLVVANFSNILLAILAPTARRLMCDISPCGGGRCFFAVAPNGDMFPCSEFIGISSFKGGNLFKDQVDTVLHSEPFKRVTGRKVEDIEPCRRCAIRHFCGSPCPAEAEEMNGGMHRTGAFCGFYEDQVRYAFRLIADGRADDYLWDGWDRGMRRTFQYVV
jgi:uncharacterized protein